MDVIVKSVAIQVTTFFRCCSCCRRCCWSVGVFFASEDGEEFIRGYLRLDLTVSEGDDNNMDEWMDGEDIVSGMSE